VGSVKEELEEMEKKLVSAQSDSEDMLAAISTDLDVVIKSTAELQETLTAALSAIVNVSEACRQGTEKIEREKDAELAELKKQLVVAEAETAVVTAAAGDGEEMEALVAELDKLKETMEALEWQLAASNAQLQAVFPHQPNFISFFN
jgi:DNA repair exonuclease SbcCD ATPase subunit